MGSLYEIIENLCREKGITVTDLCREAGVSRSNLTDLKKGRQKGLSAVNLDKIAAYLGVTVGYLLGTETKKEPDDREKSLDDELKVALFGGAEDVTDAMWDEVKQFAQMVKLREDQKKKKG